MVRECQSLNKCAAKRILCCTKVQVPTGPPQIRYAHNPPTLSTVPSNPASLHAAPTVPAIPVLSAPAGQVNMRYQSTPLNLNAGLFSVASMFANIQGLPAFIPKAINLIFAGGNSPSSACPSLAPPLTVTEMDYFVTGTTFGYRATICGSVPELSFLGSAVMNAFGVHYPTTFGRCRDCTGHIFCVLPSMSCILCTPYTVEPVVLAYNAVASLHSPKNEKPSQNPHRK